MNDNDRSEYAALFNTLPKSVKGWDELTEAQQSQVRNVFAGEIDKLMYGRCVYEVDKNGMILSRRQRIQTQEA